MCGSRLRTCLGGIRAGVELELELEQTELTFFYSTDSTPVQNRSSSSTIPSRSALFGAAPVGAGDGAAAAALQKV